MLTIPVKNKKKTIAKMVKNLKSSKTCVHYDGDDAFGEQKNG